MMSIFVPFCLAEIQYLLFTDTLHTTQDLASNTIAPLKHGASTTCPTDFSAHDPRPFSSSVVSVPSLSIIIKTITSHTLHPLKLTPEHQYKQQAFRVSRHYRRDHPEHNMCAIQTNPRPRRRIASWTPSRARLLFLSLLAARHHLETGGLHAGIVTGSGSDTGGVVRASLLGNFIPATAIAAL